MAVDNHRTHLRVVGVVVARQGSTRLPGKALAPVEGKPVIGHIIDRVKATAEVSETVLATSTLEVDDELSRYVESIGVPVFRGHPEDVLDRIYHASQRFRADAVVEVGGDCPFVDPKLLSEGIRRFREGSADFVSNAFTAPFTYPVGYDFILITAEALGEAFRSARLSSERQQPFQFVVGNPERFRIDAFFNRESTNDMRWTLDYPEDLAFVRAVFGRLYATNPLFGYEEICDLLRREPDLTTINARWAQAVTASTAWYTGSFVAEVHADVRAALEAAAGMEDQGAHARARQQYLTVLRLVGELARRSEQMDADQQKGGAGGRG